jgi:ectoine hydroxylase-related dioxygenase (phytanoyl-CoA dioxygenase family)
VDWATRIEEQGYGVTDSLFDGSELQRVMDTLESVDLERSRAGMRHILKQPEVATIANSTEMVSLAASSLGGAVVPFRATLFEKSPKSNWLVAWHQDTALCLCEKRPADGWGPWSVKDGVNYAHAPARALEKIVALRLHLDDSNASNGPLRVLPGTHRSGVMSDEEVYGLSEKIEAIECHARVGAVILMKPLIIHASSKSISNARRRVLHIEYAASLSIDNELELAIA